MAAILGKILPVGPSILSKGDEDDDKGINGIEYSFAIEYKGPPVAADIPRAIPVDVDHLPMAAAISSSYVWSLNNISLPVIQPIVKTTNPVSHKFPTRPGIGSEPMPAPKSSVAFNVSEEKAAVFPDGGGSSGKSDGHGSLHEPAVGKDGSGPPDIGDHVNSDSAESGLSSPGLSSSEMFSCKGEDVTEETPQPVGRQAVVTFRVPELSDMDQAKSDSSEDEDIQVVQMVPRNGKKGSCYRCLKGNRFTEKEVCIVCNAKYCIKCVLRAMGSMPEGRKCVTCIGRRINETKRGSVGKRSRLLNRLLTELEVKRIMSSELSCKVNQLPRELVYVNGDCLSEDELFQLLNCPNPPKKLKPGCYWYDRVSGFWGKEGHGPCQIISPQLNVGGHIKQNASNGNTDILINNREITKKELWMLQLAGVQCEGKPHLWVSADGSYQEEGQKNIKGCIWGKTRVKLLCTVLSLPVPPDPMNSSANEVRENTLGMKTLHKLLLVGYKRSGTSTIYKQAKIVYKVPFSDNESQNIKLMIQSNLYGYLAILLEWRERFEEESLLENATRKVADCSGPSVDRKTVYSISPRLKAFSDWLLHVKALGNLEVIFPAATSEYATFVRDLLRDAAFQATYNRRDEFEMLPRTAPYFLERATEISRTDYEPSDMDILYAEGVTSSNGLSCMEFSFPKSERDNALDPDYQHDPSFRYQLIRLHPSSLGDNCKWLEMFDDIDIVLFSVSLTDYDEYAEDNNGVLVNKMLASRQLFERIVTHPIFDQKNFLLILSKYDLLKEKIERVPLNRCEWFQDFRLLSCYNHCSTSSNRNNNTQPAHRAFQYIAMKFKRLFKSLSDRKLYVSLVTGLEPDSVDAALRYGREIIKWEREEHNFTNPGSSSTDIEQSSSL